MNTLLLRAGLLFVALWLMLAIDPLAAATLHLKNGNTINAQQIVDEGDKFRLYISDSVTMAVPKEDVARAEHDPPDILTRQNTSPDPFTFTFDVWTSGISIDQAFRVAKVHDLPLVRDGAISPFKGYNPKLTEPYAANTRVFKYQSTLFGRVCFVRLFFTPDSAKLYQVRISFGGAGDREELEREIRNVLTEKYGKYRDTSRNLFTTTYLWLPSKNIQISLYTHGGLPELYYVDKTVLRLKEAEDAAIKAQKRQEYLKRDKGKL